MRGRAGASACVFSRACAFVFARVRNLAYACVCVRDLERQRPAAARRQSGDMTWWKTVLRGDAEIDLQKIDPEVRERGRGRGDRDRLTDRQTSRQIVSQRGKRLRWGFGGRGNGEQKDSRQADRQTDGRS